MNKAPAAPTNMQVHVEELQNDPPFMLEAMRLSFERTGDDAWVWEAIDLYAEPEIKFPTWIFEHLKKRAAEKRRERKAPDRGLEFVLNFAGRIDGGEAEPAARAEASVAILGADAPDDRTLQRWINEQIPIPDAAARRERLDEFLKTVPEIDEASSQELARGDLANARKHALTEFFSRADVLELLAHPTKSR
jgi:hypothetical protein